MGEATHGKILMIGLAETGKTTIIKVVTEGYKPEKDVPYAATRMYKRKKAELFGKKVVIFDLGGQETFLKRFTGELAEFIFSDVVIMIFTVDMAKPSDYSNAKFYFELALTQLRKFSPGVPTCILLHKVDLIKEEKIAELSGNLQSFLISDLQEPELINSLKFFDTSVYSDSIFRAMASIFSQITGFRIL